MKELDFLPQSYHDAARRRVEFRRNVFMTLGLVLAMACLHGLNLVRVQSAEAALAALRNGQGGWQSARSLVASLEARKALGQQRLELINRLEDAAPLDAAIGELAGLLTESMAISGLYVNTTVPAAPPAPGQAIDREVPSAPATTWVRMTGMAANDVEVGIFLGKLGACPLFSDVTLSFSRDARNAGKRMREFEVKFTLRPVEST